MRFRFLSVFLVAQLISFAVWNIATADSRRALAPKADQQVVRQVSKSAPGYKVQPVSTGSLRQVVNSTLFNSKKSNQIRYTARNMVSSDKTLNSIRQNQLRSALNRLPQDHTKTVDSIILDFNENANRGLGGRGIIIIRAVSIGTEELISVLVHEMAHNVDYGYLRPENKKRVSPFMDADEPLYETDPSIQFYRISWLTDTKRKKKAVNNDFVSGYAMTDPHEDFAETYNYYVFQNKDFKVLAANSDALLAKYRFMKYAVFNGEEFDTGDGRVRMNNRPWDTTLLGYDLNDFMS